jgi:hypothetical protein
LKSFILLFGSGSCRRGRSIQTRSTIRALDADVPECRWGHHKRFGSLMEPQRCQAVRESGVGVREMSDETIVLDAAAALKIGNSEVRRSTRPGIVLPATNVPPSGPFRGPERDVRTSKWL